MAKYFRVNNFVAPYSLLSSNSSGDLICNMLIALTVEAELPLVLLLGWAVGLLYQTIPEHYFTAEEAAAPSPRPALKSPLSSHHLQLNPDLLCTSPSSCLHFCCARACPHLLSSSQHASQSFFFLHCQLLIFLHVIPYSAATPSLPHISVPLAVTICTLTTSLQLLPPQEFVHSLRSSSMPQEPTTAHTTMGMLIVLIDDRNQYPHTWGGLCEDLQGLQFLPWKPTGRWCNLKAVAKGKKGKEERRRK